MTKILLTFAAVFAFGVSAQADQPINPWLHCGIGAMIFNQPGLEVGAGISNIIWDLGTTAVSSKISSEDSCAGNPNVAAAKMITESYAQLEAETVKGSGQYTTALLDTLNCDKSAHSAIMNNVKADFGKSLQSKSYSAMNRIEKAQNYYGMVNATIAKDFAGSCGA